MSQVSTYVYCSDGYFYTDLVYRDKDWFICFDDDEPVELVAKKDKPIDPELIIKQLGIPIVGLYKKPSCCKRLFSGKFTDAYSWFMSVKLEPFPAPRPQDKYSKKISIEEAKKLSQGVYYGRSHK